MGSFFCGLDLGQSADYTACIIVERHETPRERPAPAWTFAPVAGTTSPLFGSYEPSQRVLDTAGTLRDVPRTNAAATRYDVRHIERYPLGTSYPAIVDHVHALLQRAPLRGNVECVVDASGVGRAVIDLFQRRMRVRPVTITSGATVSQSDDGYYRVPKIDLVSCVQTLLQQGRLKFAASLPNVDLLTAEMQNYQVKLTASAHETFNARSGQHDDLVLALALACWYADQHGGIGIFF